MSPRVGTGGPRRPPARGPQGRRPGGGRPHGQRPASQTDARPSLPAAKRRDPVVVEIPPTITVKDLCEKLGASPAAVIKELIGQRILATVNQSIDYETAATVARNLGAEVLEASVPTAESAAAKDEAVADATERRSTRPPVVTIMGHVDHGKTSLLDAIRATNVAAREAGGITQHIGAYQVEINGQKITFLDTPGHEAFTAMRARGAKATDIAVLVVAADDGVQPQTLEAINHARAAKVPIVVAINKVDKADAQPDRVKQQLSDSGLIVEEWGGDTVSVEVSARQKKGIEHLLEMILLVAEIQELKANPNRPAEGVVVEAKLDRNRGPVATVLIQEGSLKPGDNIVAGATYGKVRAMFSDQGKRLKRADPAMPVEVLGLVDVPSAGDAFRSVEDERSARQASQDAANRQQAEVFAQSRATTLEAMSTGIGTGEVKDLNIIIKTDVQGSAQPVRESLDRLSTEEVKVQVLHVGTGNVTESDVLLAQASRAIIVGFNVRVEPGAQRLAESSGIDIRVYSVIYNVIEDVQKALTGMLEPKFVDVVEGHAEVRQVFKVGRTGSNVAGCYVLDGRISRNSTIRVLRGGKSLFEGKIASLRRFKDDVRDVAAGYECGLGLEGFNDYELGDILESVRRERAL